MIENEKYKKLIHSIKNLESVVVAFSGGVDSTFLIKAAKEALGDKMIAVTVVAPYIPKWEIEEATVLIQSLGITHEFLRAPYIMEEIKYNPPNRCYLCKNEIFSKIKKFAEEKGFAYVLDGTNADDLKDYRPGLKALAELDIKSPLLENGITKEEIRDFSKLLELPTWNKPAYACLLSRIPYGEEIKEEELEKIEKAEAYLIELGFRAVRVRCHKDLARIEVPKMYISKLLERTISEQICQRLRTIGFKYITIDMEGYRMGSLNEVL